MFFDDYSCWFFFHPACKQKPEKKRSLFVIFLRSFYCTIEKCAVYRSVFVCGIRITLENKTTNYDFECSIYVKNWKTQRHIIFWLAHTHTHAQHGLKWEQWWKFFFIFFFKILCFRMNILVSSDEFRGCRCAVAVQCSFLVDMQNVLARWKFIFFIFLIWAHKNIYIKMYICIKRIKWKEREKKTERIFIVAVHVISVALSIFLAHSQSFVHYLVFTCSAVGKLSRKMKRKWERWKIYRKLRSQRRWKWS